MGKCPRVANKKILTPAGMRIQWDSQQAAGRQAGRPVWNSFVNPHLGWQF